ncbi:toxin TcdB middle/N-terminal domain-containing protein [Treponema sp. OMZ 838]|uniref:toxin TcdB middle/N-terminal domain-containing protein n=1 Tax=Treponema sp. OMZ 838 TaxID=1539298 RepID=UPI000AA46FEF|nr:toxin TcdB middle/N-terminal domain-containing protein [Treponema sp. OMZ 838]
MKRIKEALAGIVKKAVFTVYLFTVIAPTGVYGQGRREGSRGVKREASELVAQKVIGEEGGVLEAEGVRFVIPRGAVEEATKITISRLYEVAEGGEVKNVTAGFGGWRFLPKGMKFKKACELSLEYDERIEAEYAEEIYTYYYDEKEKRWVALERKRVDEEGKRIESYTDHFTDMINGTLSLPESPEPVRVNLNSIKELKAADAAGGIEGIEGLQGGSEGSAAFGIKLKVPEGVKGMAPELSLRYASGSGWGLLGKGWSLGGIESISIDTRFGLPEYNGKDTYLVEGSRVRYEGGAWIKEQEQRYERIANGWVEGRGVSENYFEVTGKDGGVKIYGKERWSGKGAGAKYIYYLDRERDSFGNEVQYVYKKETGAEGEEVLLEQVIYGKERDRKVTIAYEGRGDTRIDGRGKYVRKESKRIASIEMSVGGRAIRAYGFEYRENEMGESLLERIAVKGEGEAAGYGYEFGYEQAETDERGRIKVFGETEGWERSGSIAESVHISGGGSGSGGAGVNFGGAVSISGGMTASAGSGSGHSKRNFVDVTGDGIADIVEWKKGEIRIYEGKKRSDGKIGYERAEYFDGKALKGLYLSENEDWNWSVGGKVDINVGIRDVNAGTGRGLTKQWSRGESKSEFTDVNRDGYVDFVSKGRYYENDRGRGFKEGVGLQGVEKVGLGVSEAEKREAEKGHYFQEGVQAWRSAVSGKVEIGVEVKEIGAGQLSVWKGTNKEGVKIGECREKKAYVFTEAVRRGEYIYFATETDNKAEIGESVKAGIRIRYSEYQRDELLGAHIAYQLPERLTVAQIDETWKRYYEADPGGSGEWKLKAGNYVTRLDEEAIEKILEKGYYTYIGSEIGKDAFEAFYNGLGTDTAKESLKKSMEYDGGFEQYVYDGQESGATLNSDVIKKMSEAEQKEAAGYKNVDGGVKYPLYYEDGKAYYRDRLTLKTNSEREKGARGYEDTEGIAVGAINGKTYRLGKEGGTLVLYEQGKRKEEAIITKEGDTVKAVVDGRNKTGYEFSIVLEGRTLGKIISEQEYEKGMGDIVERGIEYRISRVEGLSEAAYEKIKDKTVIKNAQMVAIGTLYEKAGNKRRLKESEGALVIQAIAEALKEARSGIKVIIEQREAGEVRIREVGVFTAEEKEAIGREYFEAIGSLYQIKSGIGEAERAQLEKKLKRYESEAYDFPYFTYDGAKKEYRTTKEHLEKEEVRKFLAYVESYYYEEVGVVVEYPQESRYPVRDGKIAIVKIQGGQVVTVEEEIAVYRGNENYESGKYEGTAGIEGFNRHERMYGGGKRWYYGLYSRWGEQKFSIASLFAPNEYDESAAYKDENVAERKKQNIKESQKNGEEEKNKFAKTLKENGNEEAIGETVKAEVMQKIQEGVTLGGYIPVQRYQTYVKKGQESEPKGEAPKKERRSGLVFSKESLIGAFASTSENGFDREGEVSSTIHYYAAYIDNEVLHSSRITGGAYKNLPWVKDGGFALSANESSSFDKTLEAHAGVSVASINASVGFNKGESKQVQSYQDIDGDGYPDIVKTSSGGLSVQYGNAEGVFQKKKGGIQGGALSTNSNESKVFGAGIGLSGSVGVIRDTEGRVKSITLEPAGSTPHGASVNEGVNYSRGWQQQTGGLVDINGDGLPDYQTAAGAKLNLGEEFRAVGAWQAVNVSEGSVKSGGGNFGIGVSAGAKANYGGGNLGVNVNISQTATESLIADINGDGLPDVLKVKEDGSYAVKLNYGAGFDGKEKTIEIRNIEGAEYAAYYNRVVADLVGTSEKIQVPYRPENMNKSTERSEIEKLLQIPKALEFNTSQSVGVSGGLSGQIGFLVWVGIFITCNFSGGVNGTYSKSEVSLRLFDVDGDGLADRVFNIGGSDKLYVQRNKLGKVGLLKTIHLPTGGSYEIEYQRVGNTRELPQSKYVLSSVTMNSGLQSKSGNIQSYRTTYTYKDGYYDRKAKEFYGFKTVKAVTGTGKTSETEYYIDAYYRKGMVKKETVSHNGIVYSIKEYETDEVPHARVKREWNTIREGYRSIQTESDYRYDRYGNVTELDDKGDVSRSDDDIIARIRYWDSADERRYFKAHPERIEVLDGKSGRLLRKREGRYDNNTGAITELKQYISSGTSLTYTIDWDEKGNIKTLISPTGKKVSYRYQDGIYPVKITEEGSKGGTPYESTLLWDSALGVKLEETDSAGNTMKYRYDGFGRVTEVKSPYDTGNVPYAKYEYHTPSSSFWYTVTANKLTTKATDKAVMKTIVMHDGLGRALYTAKEGEVYREGTAGETNVGWNISGATYYDEAGRKIKEGMPFFYGGDLPNELANKAVYASVEQFYELNDFTKLRNETVYTYDGIDRVIKTLLPDGSEQKNEYAIENSLQVTTATDPLENKSVTKKDARGNIREVERRDKANNILTKGRYEYSVLGEMLRAYDANENIVSVTYDLLGRKVALESKDTGRKEWRYDSKGLLEAESDSLLRSKLSEIQYVYDGFDRLIKIDYPFSEDVTYEYGEAGQVGAGEIIRKKDESGEIRYKYGKLSEVVEETRTIKRYEALSEPETATFTYRSDYLGRMQTMKYPDGETITYTYDKGGQLKGVSGVKNTVKGSETYSYIDTIVYDEHGQRVYIKYGNGVETRYRYDDKRRWLKDIETRNKQTDEVFQKITYSFDKVGNVLGYSNDASVYETSQSYSYDNLYQLIGVEGTSNQYKAIKSFGSTPVNVAKYKQDFAFDGIGNMTKKSSTTNLPGARGNAYPKAELDYSLDYEYDPAYAHRLVHAGNRYYRYDANGNITAEKDGPFTEDDEFIFTYSYDPDTDVYGADYGFGLDAPKETEETRPENLFAYRRNYTWNEKNQLTKSSDRTYTVHYRYGEDGQRALKYTEEGRSETLYFNNFYTIHIPVQDKNNPQGLRVHKHIFVGNSRLVTAMTHTDNNGDNAEQREKRYYYHSDHLGSAQFVTDWRGKQYEHIEYTPYGELWIEEVAAGLDKLPFRFTGKEMDEETGLYYYGARYLDPKYSRWLSGDPALGDYVPAAGTDPSKLAGMGGVYNTVNLHLYHYAGNNPVKFLDPTGLYDEENGYTKQEIKDFKNMSVKDQLAYLKSEVGSVKKGTTAAGAKAGFMRTQLKNNMKLHGLFFSMSGDEKFMNEDLRSFLNLNSEGKNEYSRADMEKGGWFQMIPYLGDNEHQRNQNGGRNVKFCNTDGREAIFDAQDNYIGTEIDSSTYNYGYVSRFNPICITLGSTHGQYDMKPFFRQTGTKPFYWSMSVGSNYGFNSR